MKCQNLPTKGLLLFFSIISEALVSVGVTRHRPGRWPARRERRVVWPQDSDLTLTALEGNVAFLECFLGRRPFANTLSHRPESCGFLRAWETRVPVTSAFCPCRGKPVSLGTSPQALTSDVLEGGGQV